MDEQKNTNTVQPPEVIQPQTMVTSAPLAAAQPHAKKSRRAFGLLLAFLLGALTYAAVTGVYNFMHVETGNQAMREAAVENRQVVQNEPKIAEKPTSVDAEDLAKYVVSTDCTTMQGFSNIKISQSLTKVMEIDLYDGMQVFNSTLGGRARWQVLPKVVDPACKTIKITDIVVGDRVNLYIPATATKDEILSNIVLIQKATK